MFRFPITMLLGFLFLLLPDVAQAAVITIEGTVKSVDAKKRTITVQTKTKTLELDVSRKAKVSVKGKTAKLDSLKVGQKVKISYHDGLEIVLKIEATGSPSENDPPELTKLAELDIGFAVDLWISPDGLIIYWPFEGSIWTAQRKDANALFEKKRKLVPGKHVTVTADGLRMILISRRSDGQKGETLYETQRRSVDGEFSRPRAIRELRNVPNPKSPCLSQDGMTLYFNRSRNQRVEFAYATRKSFSDPWTQAKLLPVDAGNIDGDLTWIFVMNDGLTMLCKVRGQKYEGEVNNLLMLSRKSKTAPFENPKFISAEGLPPLKVARSPRYVEVTRELVFARWVQKSRFELWMVKNLDL